MIFWVVGDQHEQCPSEGLCLLDRELVGGEVERDRAMTVVVLVLYEEVGQVPANRPYGDRGVGRVGGCGGDVHAVDRDRAASRNLRRLGRQTAKWGCRDQA